jgi:hypothetical protein
MAFVSELSILKALEAIVTLMVINGVIIP